MTFHCGATGPAAWLILGWISSALADPSITREPADASVSLGANPGFLITATSTEALDYQWFFKSKAIPWATNRSLTITNAQLSDGGEYQARVADSTGTKLSRSAMLQIDPTFTKITQGPLVRDTGNSFGAAWEDYDGDGWLDLAVRLTGFPIVLYHNQGDGTFLRQAGGALAQNPSNAEGFGWADFENDGDPDLFVGSEPGPGHFYRNDGQGKFVSLTPAQVGSIAVRSGSEPETAAWADYDGDGYLDLFVGDTTGSQNLHHNEGTGKFARAPAATAGSIATDLVFGRSASWFDADGDGDLDLFVVSDNPNVDCAFYRNEGAGRFTRLMAAEVGPLVTIRAELTQSTVADYDNDGDLDLVLLAYGTNTINQLYQNNGHGVFALATAGALGTEGAYSAGASWGDYDNDGWLDLCIANLGVFGSGKGQNNFLYHNNGDGTFSRIMTGSIANEIGSSFTPVWVDYDNDGAMDLFISNGAGGPQERNFLYRNNGNANHWLKFRLRGTLSNRSAIGAKVRVKATVWGKSFWQMRQITVGDGLLSAQEPRPHFGLGDATSAETVRIEWPSGIVQEFVNVRADQSLVLTEPSQLLPSVRRDGGSVDLMVRAWAGQSFVVESSAQLGAWQLVATVTNLTGTLRFADPSTSQPQQFYRLRSISP